MLYQCSLLFFVVCTVNYDDNQESPLTTNESPSKR